MSVKYPPLTTLAREREPRGHPTRLAVPTRPARRIAAGLGALARAATTPLLPSDYLDLVAPLRFGVEARGRVEARHQETARTVTLVIRPGRGPLTHRPGQYVRIGAEVNGVRHWRTYSFTSAPDADDGCFSITVTKVDDGLVSSYLVDDAHVGTLLLLGDVAGDFVVDESSCERALFVTAGSGITPVMGILRSHPELTDVVLVHSARTADDVVFAAQLRRWALDGRLRLVERHTATQGRLDLADLDDLVPDWRERTTWVCGPAGLLDAAHTHWDDADLGDRLRVERFRPVVAATGEGGVVTFARTGRDVDADGDRPILDSGEDAGVLMPSGCRMGICFGCAVPLTSGTVRDLRNGDLTTASPGDGVVVQTCVSAPAGPCVIDL